jgi:hypothetical protein
MSRVPYNGYLEIWLQRITQNKAVQLHFESKEKICKIVNGQSEQLWENAWIENPKLREALNTNLIIVGSAINIEERIRPEEVALFREKSLAY